MKREPIIPNSEEEWTLELKVFNIINNDSQASEKAKKHLKELWAEVVFREDWYYKLYPEGITNERQETL